MSRALDISADQSLATDRHNLYGVVYLLSGTLPGRGAIPAAPFYWASAPGVVALLGVSGAEIEFDHFFAPPVAVERGMLFTPGGGVSDPAIRLHVRNLPFAHASSIVAAVSDSDFAIEHSEATLRVGYLKPGQEASELVAADWTPLVSDGFFGAPQGIRPDGLTLVLYNRGAKRNQIAKLAQLPSIETVDGVIDRSSASAVPPIIIGRPNSWLKPLVADCGIRGFTVSGYGVGATEIKFRTMSAGADTLLSGTVWFGASESAAVMVHNRTPVYPVVTGLSSYDPETEVLTITLASGLSGTVPQGAYVQQHAPGMNSAGARHGSNRYKWCLANNNAFFGPRSFEGSVSGEGSMGWRFADGSIRAVEGSDRWELDSDDTLTLEDFDTEPKHFGGAGVSMGAEFIAQFEGILSAPKPPIFWDPSVGAEVEQQPDFGLGGAQEVMGGKINRATGGTGVDNEKMRDGSETTGAGFADSDVKTLTFPSAPGNFANDDTTASVLHIIAQGNLLITNAGGGTVFASITVAGALVKYAFQQASAREFNETIRIVGQPAAGGTVAEAWWEHDLAADIAISRTQDVVLGGASGSAVGEVMEYAELVVKAPLHGTGWLSAKAVSADGSPSWCPWRDDIRAEIGASDFTDAARPTAVIAGLATMLGKVEGLPTLINSGSYDAAHARFQAVDIRLNGLIDNLPRSWSEIEADIAMQTRSRMFYGPSGHEIIFLESDDALEEQVVQQSFRLPGCPGANVFETNAPLMDRTPVSEIVNSVEIEWDRDWIENRNRRFTRAQNASSVALVGERKLTGGPLNFYLHAPIEGNPSYDAAASVSGLAQFYADRYAFSRTRFSFDTGWIAHGLDRGSVVRVSYPVAADTYRNVIAEVESVRVSPQNAERFSLVCRAVGTPQKGLEPNFTWNDVFDDDSDQWGTTIENEFDTWARYWSVSGGA